MLCGCRLSAQFGPFSRSQSFSWWTDFQSGDSRFFCFLIGSLARCAGLEFGRIMLRTHKQRQQTHKSSPAHWQKLTKTKRWRAKETKRQIATERQTNEDAARTDTNTLTWLLNGPLGGFQKADVGSNNNRLIVYSAGSSSKYCEFRSTLYTSGYLCCHTGRYL